MILPTNSRSTALSADTPEHFYAQGYPHAIDESYRFGSSVSSQVLNSTDASEVLKAFQKRRALVWAGL